MWLRLWNSYIWPFSSSGDTIMKYPRGYLGFGMPTCKAINLITWPPTSFQEGLWWPSSCSLLSSLSGRSSKSTPRARSSTSNIKRTYRKKYKVATLRKILLWATTSQKIFKIQQIKISAVCVMERGMILQQLSVGICSVGIASRLQSKSRKSVLNAENFVTHPN